jgi:hypothetical protein
MTSILCLVGAIYLAVPISRLIQDDLQKDLPLLYAYAASVVAGGFLAYFCSWLFLYGVARFFRLHRKWDGTMKYVVHWGGTIIGVLFGTIILMLFWWFILWDGKLAAVMVEAAESSGKKLASGQERILAPSRAMIAQREGLLTSYTGRLAQQTNPFPDKAIEEIGVLVTALQQGVFSKPQNSEDSEAEETSSGSGESVATEESGSGETATGTSEGETGSDQQDTNGAASDIINSDSMQSILDALPLDQLMAIESMQQVIENGEVRALAEEGDILGLMNHPAMANLLNDPEVMDIMSEIDMESMQKLFSENPELMQ